MKEKCLMLDCDEPRHGRGFCNNHYQQLKRKEFPMTLIEYRDAIKRCCTIENCDFIHFGKGYCKKHYSRYWRYGSPDIIQKKGPPKNKCSIEGCDKWCHGNGYCVNHYLKLSNPRNLESDDLYMFIAKYNVRKKYNNKCQWYGCDKTPLEIEIHVHHIFPKNEYPELKYIEEYMILYCKNHHAYWHQVRGDKYHNLIRNSNVKKLEVIIS